MLFRSGIGAGVRRGDVISAVGRTADCEADMDWHLHFSLEKDGVPMDFEALAGVAEEEHN